MAGAASLLANSNFDTDLSGWTTTGDAQHSPNFAVLTDALGSSTIHQTSSNGAGQYSFVFDFLGAPSGGQGPLLDTIFFSIYLGDNAFVSPTSAGSFDEVITLFDIDANGVNNTNPGVAIIPHPTNAGWSRAAIDFSTVHTNITPHVQLLEQNGVVSDSAVGLDSFELNAVPEPGSLSLLGLAAVLCLTRRRKYVH